MTRARLLALCIVASSVAGGLTGAACSSSSSAPPPVNQTTTDVLNVGVVLSLTGSLNYLGGPEEQGMRTAVAQVNALGGVLGKQLGVVLIDDTTDPNTCTSAFNTVVQQNLVATVGPSGSPEAVAASPVLYQAKVLEISPSASTPQMSDAQPAVDRYFFRTAASHAVQAKAIARWIAKGPPGGTACKRPAVIYQNDAFGSPLGLGFATDLSLEAGDAGGPIDAGPDADGGSSGGPPVVAVSIPVPNTAATSYTTQVQQVIASGADCQVLMLFQALGKQYMLDWVKATTGNPTYDPARFTTLGCNALDVDSFIAATRTNPADPQSPTAIEGMYALNFDSNPATPEYGSFKNIHTAKFPLTADQTNPPAYTANTYDAVILIALALEKAGTYTDRVKVRDALFAVSRGSESYGPGQVADALAAIRAGKDVKYKGASGDLVFDDFGDVLQDFVVFKVQQGAFSLVEKIKASSL
jgi:ABC-type branched-subunit amino acid transport system substrate-binding protein